MQDAIELTRRFLRSTATNGTSSAKCVSWTDPSSAARRDQR